MFNEPLDSFFNTAQFADAALWQTQTINVIFDEEYSPALGVSSNAPSALVQTADVVGVVRGQNIVINSVSYVINSVEKESTALTRLMLVKE